ncbi:MULTISPECIES: outer membrane protein [unclassified Ruegeria]|uniref:outer membrane protein n=1 Tax=unclassified Ruegeria TaxID=2625375 RepID=UPI001489FEAA|nr:MULTISPECIES: porin family protein [unclassified Ruegeria]
MRKFALLSLIPLVQAVPDAAHADSTSAASAFEGVYAGLEIGAAAADGTTDFPVLSGGTRNASFDPDNGRSFGALFGYNMQRGDMIYGAEVRYSNLSHVVEKGDPETREVMDFADLRGRVGYVNGDFMFYGALGWSWSRLRVHPSAQFDRESQTTLDGFNIGLGMEYNFNDRWFAGADYTYRDVSGDFDDAPNDSDFDLSTITARVAYRF